MRAVFSHTTCFFGGMRMFPCPPSGLATDLFACIAQRKGRECKSLFPLAFSFYNVFLEGGMPCGTWVRCRLIRHRSSLRCVRGADTHPRSRQLGLSSPSYFGSLRVVIIFFHPSLENPRRSRSLRPFYPSPLLHTHKRQRLCSRCNPFVRAPRRQMSSNHFHPSMFVHTPIHIKPVAKNLLG